MPRGKTRARLRAARPPVRASADPMDDDSGRTPARVDYTFREIGRRLRLARERDEALARARQGNAPLAPT